MAPKRARRGSREEEHESLVSASQITNNEGWDTVAGTSRDKTISRDGETDGSRSISADMMPEEDPDLVRILLATDNHVGYMERDPVRGMDSINTFREILQLAKERDVDFILLGGDLFHENRPSRTTVHQVMGALREFTFGDKPVSFELLSDPNDGRPEGYSFPAVNFEDENLNVAIPVFSIHGNHDDPQGVGAQGALSAVDLLSVSGLINYFGKVELPSADALAQKGASQAPSKGGLSDVGIRIRPVLLRKGRTRVALYGMGNIKDERMHYELRSNRVRMYRPIEHRDDWFNILAIHQNRAAHDPKAVVPETMFDDSVHLVVWGHEHEQLIKPQSVVGKRYQISQPGSSVATSLCPGEAVEKQVAIIHIKERDYRLEQIPLKTVRPFVMEEIDLDEVAEEAKIRVDDKIAVTKLLKGRVQELIDRANREWEEKHGAHGGSERTEMPRPLVRLRVHYTRHDMGNLVRFGQSFLETVANPRDLLQFSKKKGESAGRKRNSVEENYVDPMEDMLPSEKLEKVRMSDLVQTYLATQQLHILNPLGLEKSVMKFVDKDDREAISHFVEKELKQTNARLAVADFDERALETELERIREQKNRIADEAREDQDPDDQDDDGNTRNKGGRRSADKQRAGASAGRHRHGSLDDSAGSDDERFEEAFNSVPKKSSLAAQNKSDASRPAVSARNDASSAARATSIGRRGGTQTKLTFRGNSDDESDPGLPTQKPTPAPPLSARAAALARPAAKKGTARGGKGTASASKKAAGTTNGSASRRGGSTRAAAQKANSRMSGGSQVSDEGGDDVEYIGSDEDVF